MDKFKEWLNSISNLDYIDPTVVIEEYDKFHPNTIKLSEIVERLKKDLDDAQIYYHKLRESIGYDFYTNQKTQYWQSLVYFNDNKVQCLDFEGLRSFYTLNDLRDTIDYLYQLKLDGTEIINDLEGKNG